MRIVLVRLRLIGDVVFTTPIIRAVRRRYPDAHITYVVEQAAAPIVAHNPHLNEVIVAAHSRGWRRVADDVRLARRLKAGRFDIAIDLHGGPRSAWLSWATRARIRVGYDVAGRTWMYTHVAHRRRPSSQPGRPALADGRVRPARHSVENQWDLLATLDPAWTGAPDAELDRVEMAIDTATRDAVARRLSAFGVPARSRLIVLHVSAGNPFRRWPETAFAELAAGLAAGAPDRWVLVTGGPSDRDAARRVIADARQRAGDAAPRILDGEGFALAELRGLMDRAALFVGGDSGPLHLAATSDVPVVGLYGPTLAARSAPWRPRSVPTISVEAGDLSCRPCEQRVCVHGDFRCLTGIGAGRVLDAAEQLLRSGV